MPMYVSQRPRFLVGEIYKEDLVVIYDPIAVPSVKIICSFFKGLKLILHLLAASDTVPTTFSILRTIA